VHVHGQLIGLFSFDIGNEIRLDVARKLTGNGQQDTLGHRRAAPAYLAYATPPLRAPLGNQDVVLGERRTTAAASALVHDFGAVTIILQTPLHCDIGALAPLTATLTGAGPLETTARHLLEQLFPRIAPAVSRPGLNPFVEDYYVLQIDSFEPPVGVEELLARERGPLASALRCEAHPLSEAEIAEVFARPISYYPDDLLVTEWNVALVVDRDYTDALSVLEFLNVQLLELRYYDERLDQLSEAFSGVTARPTPRMPLTYRPYRRAVEELGRIRLEVATIVERLHSALKLSGSLYLAKVYSRTAERLGMQTWETNVARKLEVLQETYDVLIQRTATARAEALELTIILLIAVEIFLFLLGWP
jgi:hypothetical protein